MRYVVIFFMFLHVVLFHSLAFADLPIPEKLSVKKATWQNDDNIRTFPEQTVVETFESTQTWAGEELPIPERIPVQNMIFPPIAYRQTIFVPTYYQMPAWQRQQAAMQQAAMQQAAMRQVAYYPPAPMFFEPELTQAPTPTPTPAAPKTETQEMQRQAPPQDAQLRITSEHTETEAILPATLTQAQKDLINELVAQQLVAEREQLHVENARIIQQEHTAQRQHTQRMVALSIGGVLVLAVVWVWSGQKCLIILRDLLHEGYKRML